MKHFLLILSLLGSAFLTYSQQEEFDQVLELIKQGDFYQGKNLNNTLIYKYPHFPEPYIFDAQISVISGDSIEAMNKLNSYLEKNPKAKADDKFNILYYAYLYAPTIYKTQYLREALDYADQITEYENRYNLAYLYENAGLIQSAIAVNMKLLKENSNDYNVPAMIGRLYLKDRNADSAFFYSLMALDISDTLPFPNMIVALTVPTKYNKISSVKYAVKGLVYAEPNDLELFSSVFISQYSNNYNILDTIVNEITNAITSLTIKKENYLSLLSIRGYYYFAMAKLYYDKNQSYNIKAFKDYSTYINQSYVTKELTNVYHMRAQTAIDLNLLDIAISDLNSALEINDKDSRVMATLAKAYLLNGDFTKSAEIYDKILQEIPFEDPNNEYFYMANHIFYLDAIAKKLSKDYYGALDNLYLHLDLYSIGIDGLLERGSIYKNIFNNTDVAYADFNKVIEYSDKKSQNHNQALAYAYMGMNEEAIKAIERSGKKSQYSKTKNYFFARAYAVMGDYENAINSLEMSFKTGNRNFVLAENELEFASIRNTPKFKALIIKWKRVYEDERNELLNMIK